MTPFAIPFSVASEHLPGLVSGQIVRYGAILKDASTGRILGHVQETGLVQSLIGNALSFDPTGVSSLIGMAQNVAISNKLNAMQQALGGIQALQYVSLFSSIIGIGVTAASTMVILKRLGAVEEALGSIENRLDDLPTKWRDLSIRSRLIDVSTSVERMQEAERRSDAPLVVAQVEKDLQSGFSHIHQGLCSIVIEAKIDPGLLRALIAGLAICGATEFKALLWLDEKEAAQHRARVQFEKLRQLALLMPREQLLLRLRENRQLAGEMSKECSEIRYRVASQPALIDTLVEGGVHGRDYLERVQQEYEEPLLLVPNRAAFQV